MALDLDGPHPTQRLLDGLHDPAVMVDGEGLVSDWNAAAARTFAILGDEARGRRPEELAGGPLAGVVRLPMEPAGTSRELIVWLAHGVADGDMVRLQREAALGRLAGGISHDLANSLGSIGMFATLLRSEHGIPPDLRDSARLVRPEAERTLRIIRGLLEVARDRPPDVTDVALGSLVRETVEIAHAALVNVETTIAIPESLPHAIADASRLRQAILALTVNAIEALGGGWGRGAPEASGRLRITGRRLDGVDARVRLEFEDGAPVIPESARPHLFTDDPPAGTPRAGRDLAAARALIVAGGGKLTHEATPVGNRFVIDLPIAAGAAAETEPRRRAAVGGGLAGDAGAAGVAGLGRVGGPEGSPSAGSRHWGTVLVCDDEAFIRTILVRMIERAGYRAVEATGGPGALALLAGEPVDMVIADQRMVGMSGVELYHAVADRHPHLRTRFVVMSGDTGAAELVTLATEAGVGLLGKPFAFERIGPLIRETLAR